MISTGVLSCAPKGNNYTKHDIHTDLNPKTQQGIMWGNLLSLSIYLFYLKSKYFVTKLSSFDQPIILFLREQSSSYRMMKPTRYWRVCRNVDVSVYFSISQLILIPQAMFKMSILYTENKQWYLPLIEIDSCQGRFYFVPFYYYNKRSLNNAYNPPRIFVRAFKQLPFEERNVAFHNNTTVAKWSRF